MIQFAPDKLRAFFRPALSTAVGISFAFVVNAFLHLHDGNFGNQMKPDRGGLQAGSQVKQDRRLDSSGADNPLDLPAWFTREDRLDVTVSIARRQRRSSGNGDSVASIEALLDPFRRDSRDARLIGFALGYGFASGARESERLPGPSEVKDAESYLHSLLPGILAARTRSPSPLPMFESIADQWHADFAFGSDTRNELCLWCVRFAAESGYLDPEGTIALLAAQAAAIDRRGRPEKEAVSRAIEIAAAVSPLTFEALLRQLEERYPGIAMEVIPNAVIPQEALASLMRNLPKKSKDDLARRLSEETINGTPAEITRLVECIPNPSELPSDVAANISVAIATVGAAQLDAWLATLDEKQRKKVFDEIANLPARQGWKPIEERVQLWELRAEEMLRATCVRRDASKNLVAMMTGLCSGRQSLPALQEFLVALGQNGGAVESREMVLRAIYGIRVASEGSDSLAARIQYPSSDFNTEDLKIALDTLVSRDPERAKRLGEETSDPSLARQLDEKLTANVNLSRPYSEIFEDLTARIPSLHSRFRTSQSTT